jgi:hypothetical protein
VLDRSASLLSIIRPPPSFAYHPYFLVRTRRKYFFSSTFVCMSGTGPDAPPFRLRGATPDERGPTLLQHIVVVGVTTARPGAGNSGGGTPGRRCQAGRPPGTPTPRGAAPGADHHRYR